MKIKTNITEEGEVDIELPFFRKDESFVSDRYLAVLDEKTQVSIFSNELLINIAIDEPSESNSKIYEAYAKWKPISEAEFLAIHEKTLQSLSLRPQLSALEKEIEQEMKDHDDLKDINAFNGAS